MLQRALAHIDRKRAELGLRAYDPTRFGRSGDARFLDFLALPLTERDLYSWSAVAPSPN
jgi:hypothetical protein